MAGAYSNAKKGDESAKAKRKRQVAVAKGGKKKAKPAGSLSK